jgi:death on curing protein
VKLPRWIAPRALQLLHAETLAEHGGLPGIRDAATLDAALARAQHVQAYEPKADRGRLAAAYGFGIVRDHPFNDGNKRAGFLAIGLFLSLNGYELAVDPVEAVEIILALAAGQLVENDLTAWVRKYIVRTK